MTVKETAGPERAEAPDTGAAPRRKGRPSHRLQRYGPAYVMLLPFAVLFLVFLIYPLGRSFYYSLTDFNGIKAPELVGLENFTELLVNDERFHKAIWNTVKYVLGSVVLTIALGLTLAIAFKTTSLRDRVLRTVFFLPSVSAGVGVVLVWKWIFMVDSWGLGNTVVRFFGGSNKAWLAEPSLSIPILVTMAVWGGAGYAMVLFVAGINAIPEELYEQASIDGASKARQFWHITLPLLRPVMVFVVITSTIGAFQIFEPVYLLWNRSASIVGGPLDSALTIVPYLYDMGFNRFQLGYASAIAWVLFLIIFLVTLVQLRVTKTFKEF
ncbi:sugar ABC transporter permease [Glycomyces sp. TRM65418]|uniref:carbohydrate ABC transporter permease n=1 Tax=Glycomyces sp. TRM65418 TaxID=2867006 RepID=UPI001CE5BF9F|nr:sugar ABC transporter permease [Glycomyces sp. TRM65418]MCC3764930.1 sugar ABC transporter permease [Glycomyces sp. TRM65418]QZD54570.1 sugar ABC transporter permease [Glycomyces sp. TRM65418]